MTEVNPSIKKKTEQPCIGQFIFTWINIIFSSNLKLQSSNLKKMTLHIPNHTIKVVVQNSKPKFSNKAIINSPQILQVSSKTIAKAVCKIDHRIIS